MDTNTAHALIRFGLGRRGNEALPVDAKAWLARQLDGPDPYLALPGPGSAEGLTALQEDRRDPNKEPGKRRERVRALFTGEVATLSNHLLTTADGFRERLAWFWYNHFTVSLRRGECTGVLPGYLREAIRPHVTGRFHDMLLAVMTHPAMIMYLDNQQSFGPGSLVGQRQKKGINENLARECLELHTVTPAAGYTQADVTSFANILSGWSIEINKVPAGFYFRRFAHEPGPKTLMGQVFSEGEEGGRMALAYLADHPATYRNLATKLVRHFVSDMPPPAAVAQIEGVLRATKGDLKAASLALIALAEAWQPLAKLRQPSDYVIAVLRALDLPEDKRPPDLPGLISGLGQPMFSAPLPNGWPDTASDWAGPEAILRRIDWAFGITGRAAAMDPDALADATLGPLLSAGTKQQMHRAGSRRDSLALLLASPEFNRR
jgi:uncharacterized protein (DUF1800 family)